jgi:20S proteasome subunit alpha 2
LIERTSSQLSTVSCSQDSQEIFLTPLATNGIVLATEKKSPSLLVDTSVIEKVAPICPNIGFVYSGMGPDFRILVAKARKIAQAYWKVYGEYPPTKVLVQEVAGVMQKATQSG